MPEEEKQRYYVSVNHSLIQHERSDSGEYEVLLDRDGLSRLQDLLKAHREREDETFRRAFVPFKSADHDQAAEQFDEQTVRLFSFLYESGTEDTRRSIAGSGLLPKLKNTGYEDPGYDGGSPLNK